MARVVLVLERQKVMLMSASLSRDIAEEESKEE